MDTSTALHSPSLLSSALHAMRRTLYYVFFFSFAVNLLSLMLPIYSLQVFDRVFTSRSLETLFALTGIVIISQLFYGALFAVRTAIIARMVEWLEQTVSPKLLRASILQAAETGQSLAGQHQRDLSAIKNFISSATPTLMDIPWALLFLVVVYIIHPLMGLLAVIGMLSMIAAAILNDYATRRMLLHATEYAVQSNLAADIIGRQSESIHAMGMTTSIVAHWEAKNLKGFELQNQAQQRSAIITAATRSLRVLLQIAITGIGAYLVLKNQLSSGGMIASSMLLARTLSPFENTTGWWKQWIAARDAHHRLQRLIVAPSTHLGTTALPTPKGTLSVEGVILSVGSSRPILRGVSFTLPAGQSLGIIGPAGAGKSTLAKALLGIYPTQRGFIRLDGADLTRWSRADVGQYIGYLSQQVELFSGSIKQNIGRMRADMDDADIVLAAKKAGVHEMILQLPEGYDTHYNATHAGLSPGQRQRIGLARALYGNPKLVILDEPNSNLDGEGEQALMKTLALLRTEKITTVIVAHRPSILAHVDHILVLRNGLVEMFGPRETVLQHFARGGAGGTTATQKPTPATPAPTGA